MFANRLKRRSRSLGDTIIAARVLILAHRSSGAAGCGGASRSGLDEKCWMCQASSSGGSSSSSNSSRYAYAHGHDHRHAHTHTNGHGVLTDYLIIQRRAGSGSAVGSRVTSQSGFSNLLTKRNPGAATLAGADFGFHVRPLRFGRQEPTLEAAAE